MDVFIISQTDEEVGLGQFKRSLNVQQTLIRDYKLKVLFT